MMAECLNMFTEFCGKRLTWFAPSAVQVNGTWSQSGEGNGVIITCLFISTTAILQFILPSKLHLQHSIAINKIIDTELISNLSNKI